MGTSQSGIFILLALSFLLPSVKGEPDAQLVKDACSKAPFADLCYTTLALAGGAANADLKDLAVAAVKAAAVSGAATSRYVANLLNGQVDDSSLHQCLSDCSDSYLDAVEQLDDSAAAVDSGGYADAKAWVTVAIADVDTCRDGCKGIHAGEGALLLLKNELVGKLCANALGVVSLLPHA